MAKQPVREETNLEKNILEDTERLADAIEALSAIGNVLKTSRLKEDALLTLIKSKTGVPKHTISQILDALATIKKTYLK